MTMNSVFVWVEFKIHTMKPILNTGKTLSELNKTGIKVPMVKYYIFGCHQNTNGR